MNSHNHTSIIWSDTFYDHATGDHPERPERVTALKSALQRAGIFEDRRLIDPLPASTDQIRAIHSQSHIDLVRQIAESGGGWLDPDTLISPASFDVACLAAGAVIQAVDEAMVHLRPAFAFVRPPGHHAEPDRGMGFCLFNNVAIAAQHAREAYSLKKLAIIDWDVHHGNGSQASFWEDPGVLYLSVHQYPFYPGTGSATERGAGAGAGSTLNVPLPAGSDDSVYLRVFSEVINPAIRAFQPELLMVSAGFDAHLNDPLAMMRMTTEGFCQLAEEVWNLAHDSVGGRLMLALEGGYNLEALGECAVGVIQTLDRLEHAARKGENL